MTSSRKGLFLQTDYFNRQVASDDNTGYNIVPYGYFTYRHMSDDTKFYFNINDLVDKGIVSTLYPVFTTSNDVNSHFLRAYLNNSNRFASYCILQKQGGSRTYMYFKKLCEHNAFFPTLNEQDKIGKFIDLLDEKIEKQQQLVELLKKYKLGLLKSIMKENNSNDKKVRFSKFNELLWKKLTLETCCNGYDNQRKPITSNQRVSGEIPYYGANGIQDYINDYIFEGEFILLAEDGGHFDEFSAKPIAQYISGKSWVNNHAHVLKSKEQYDNKFIYYALVHKDIRKYINGSSRAKLNQEDLWTITIYVPTSKEEQIKIREFLTIYDEKIKESEVIYYSLIGLKKGLLQQLFI